MTVMREMGLIAMNTELGTLYQFSLQEGRLIEKEIKCPCEHYHLYLLCVQVAGREYLALSCCHCRDIKLMNLKQKRNTSESQPMQYEVITAFSGQIVFNMCHGEENRLFVPSVIAVMELDTSTITFTKVRSISTFGSVFGIYKDLCYVPDPYRLLVVISNSEVRAMSCDNKIVWTTEYKRGLLYIPIHKVILSLYEKKIVVLNPDTGSEIQSIELLDVVRGTRALCLFNNQIIMASGRRGGGRISYFDLK